MTEPQLALSELSEGNTREMPCSPRFLAHKATAVQANARARVSLVNNYKQCGGCFTTFIDLHSFISLRRNDEHGIVKTA